LQQVTRTNFGEFLFDRFKDREAADVANADPPPDDGKEPADDGKEPADLAPHVDDRAHHRQAANPLFLDFEQYNVDVDGPNVALWAPENDNAVRASIADELKRLQLHPALAVDANPLSEWKKIEAEFPHAAPVARAVLSIPATVRVPPPCPVGITQFLPSPIRNHYCFVAQDPLMKRTPLIADFLTPFAVSAERESLFHGRSFATTQPMSS
jgi:hypothetical protein